MIFLRLLSLVAGSFVLLAAPFLLLGEREGAAPSGGWPVALAVAGLILFAAVYFFFALLAHRMSRSAALRQAGAALTGCQLLIGAAVLATASHTPAPLATAPLLCFSVCLFMAFVWPGNVGRNHRPMRPRERPDPSLSS